MNTKVKADFQNLEVTNRELLPELEAAAARVLRSGRYINGPEVATLENELCALCGARFCVAVSTGLDALRLIFRGYMELGLLKKGDEVIIPANTFIASFLAVTDCGLTAVPADVDPLTFGLDFSRLPLSEKTRAVLAVHLYGSPCWNREVFSDLHSKGILIIEDNAQAIGALSADEGFHGSRSTGNLADASAISFYPTKNVGAFGDAGAVLTNDSELATIVRQLANYGSKEKYLHTLCGLNCRMDEMQAALIGVKLPMLPKIIQERNRRARLYNGLITNPEVAKPAQIPGALQVWHQYVVRHPRRDALRRHLAEGGVTTEIHYPVACHRQECYAGNPGLKLYGPLPMAERLAEEILSLPIADATDGEIRRISRLINEFHTTQ